MILPLKVEVICLIMIWFLNVKEHSKNVTPDWNFVSDSQITAKIKDQNLDYGNICIWVQSQISWKIIDTINHCFKQTNKQTKVGKPHVFPVLFMWKVMLADC